MIQTLDATTDHGAADSELSRGQRAAAAEKSEGQQTVIVSVSTGTADINPKG